MPLDFGGLSALAGVDNWQQKRADKQANLQYLAIQDAIQKHKIEQQNQSANEIQDYLNTIGKINVLSKDKELIQAKEKDLRKNILEGINNSHGNLSMYLQTGGLTELNKYRNNLLDSEEVKRGLINAYSDNMATADAAAGLIHRNTSWEEDGKPVQGSYTQNKAAYEAGKTPTLNYQGAYARPDIGDLRHKYSQVYGEDRYNPESYVNPQTVANDVYEEARGKGLSDRDAKDYAYRVASEYQKNIQSGATPYKYKYDDKAMRDAKLLAIETANALHAKKLSEASKSSPDFYGEIMKGGFALQQPMKVSVDGYNQIWGIPPTEQTIGQKTEIPTGFSPLRNTEMVHGLATLEGLTYDKKNNVFKGKLANGNEARSFDDMSPLKDLNSHDYTVNNIEGIVHVPPPPNSPPNTPNQQFELVDITMDNYDAGNTRLEKGYYIRPFRERNFKILVPVKHQPYDIQIFNNKFRQPAKQGIYENDYSNNLNDYLDTEE